MNELASSIIIILAVVVVFALVFFFGSKILKCACENLNEVVWLSREYFSMWFIKNAKSDKKIFTDKSAQCAMVFEFVIYCYLLCAIDAEYMYICAIFIKIMCHCVLQGLDQVAVATFFLTTQNENKSFRRQALPSQFKQSSLMNCSTLCTLAQKMELKACSLSKTLRILYLFQRK